MPVLRLGHPAEGDPLPALHEHALSDRRVVVDLGPGEAAVRRAGTIAVLAALLASLSDFVLLWASAGAAGRPGPGAAPAGVLMPATYVGVLAILGYAVGYWQVACGLVGAGEAVARRVFVAGALMAGVGAVIHGMTGLTIRYETLGGGDVPVARAIAALLPLWLLGLACGAVAAVAYIQAVLRGTTAYPRWMAAANPIVLPVAIGGLSALVGERVRAFVVPAAPNLGHVVFFGLTTLTRRRAR